MTPILLLIVTFLMGGGHGTYIPAMVLFPYGMVGTCFQDSISIPFTILGIIQFPCYGLLLDNFEKKILKYLILLTHVLLSILILLISNFK